MPVRPHAARYGTSACSVRRMPLVAWMQAPPDLIRTVTYGTLLYDSSSSEEELQLAVPYRPIEEAFREAVELVQAADRGK